MGRRIEQVYTIFGYRGIEMRPRQMKKAIAEEKERKRQEKLENKHAGRGSLLAVHSVSHSQIKDVPEFTLSANNSIVFTSEE